MVKDKTKWTRHCPRCQEPTEVTSWRPADGYNPTLREFRCKACGFGFYEPVPDSRRKLLDKVQAADPE